jgi:hypothetical protein
MISLENINITWKDDEISRMFFKKIGGVVATSNDYDLLKKESYRKLNLDIVVFKEKTSTLKNIVKAMIVLIGIDIADKNIDYIYKFVAILILTIIYPFEIKLFEGDAFKNIRSIIDNEYGDKFIEKSKLTQLYKNEPESKKIIRYFLRNNFLVEEDTRMYFKKNILTSINISKK